MKKERLKGFITGILIASLVFMTIKAAPVKKSLSVFYNNIQVVVDGVKINPTDAKENKAEPFAYDGTIYLPLRTVAESLGKEVTWDQKTYTAYIGKERKDIVGINELEPWNSYCSSSVSTQLGYGWYQNDNKFILSQKTYTTQNSISATFYSEEPPKIDSVSDKYKHTHSDGSVWYYWVKMWRCNTKNPDSYEYDYHFGGSANYSYKINKEFYKLTGVFGVDDLSTGAYSANLKVIGDNGKILFSDSVAKGDEPIIVDVDILDQSEIEIVLYQPIREGLQSADRTNYVQFTDVKLYRVGGQ